MGNFISVTLLHLPYLLSSTNEEKRFSALRYHLILSNDLDFLLLPYTVMSNHHLKDRTLTLKSKGLLSMMLSLPDEWNYTTRGLAAICREGVDSIGAALKELENHGYIRRTQLRDEKGKITDTEYVIYEMPQCEPPSSPGTPLPGTAKPYTENPDMGIPDTAENPAQLNTNQTKTNLSSTEISNPIPSNPPTPQGQGWERIG